MEKGDLMQIQKTFAALLLSLCAVFPLGAASVSFLIIETGMSPEIPINQYSILWEDSLMDVFFESGHIVSNAPLMRLARKPADGFPDEAEGNFNEAKNGGMEYFFVAVMNHPENNVSMRLFNTESRKMIDEQGYTSGISVNMREERENIKNAIRAMAAHIME